MFNYRANWRACAAGLAAAAALWAPGAQAAITQLTFTGTGSVAAVKNGIPGLDIDAGDIVQVNGVINLGDGSRPDLVPIIPDNFTGEVVIGHNAYHDGYAGYSWSIVGDGTNLGDNTDLNVVFGSAVLQLLNGHLYSFEMSVDQEPGVESISSNSFYSSLGSFGSRSVIGFWDYDQPDSMVPEPTTWALMIGGFGLVGATLRRRRTYAPAASSVG